MLTIAVTNLKGGVGKSTISAALAVRAADAHDLVALGDLDPQKSLAAWWHVREKKDNPTLLDGVDTPGDAAERLRLAGFNIAILDSGPAMVDDVEEIMAVADFAVIPARPSPVDLASTADTIFLAREAGTPLLIVLNGVDGRNAILADEAAAALRKLGAPVAVARIRHRVAHVRAMTVGKSAAEVDGGRHREAIAEIDAVWQEIFEAATATASKTGPRAGLGVHHAVR